MPCDWAVLYLQDDLSLSGYKKHLTSQAAPLPLTAAEEELRQIKLNEVTHTHTHRQVIWILSLGHRLELSSSWRKRCSVQCLLHTCGHLLTRFSFGITSLSHWRLHWEKALACFSSAVSLLIAYPGCGR